MSMVFKTMLLRFVADTEMGGLEWVPHGVVTNAAAQQQTGYEPLRA